MAHWGSLLRAGLLTQDSLHSILKRVRPTMIQREHPFRHNDPQAVLDLLQKLRERLNRLKPRAKRKTNHGNHGNH